MSLILIIETATPICSVALCRDGKVIAVRDSAGPNDHASQLAVLVKQLFEEASLELSSLNAVAVSKGPGSYTGLRIGVSTAKGLCYALGKPMIALETLEGMAYGMIHDLVRDRSQDSRTLFCPMIDARRMEVYCAVYTADLKKVMETKAEIIDQDSFKPFLDAHPMIFFGDGAAKTSGILGNHPNYTLAENFLPSASYFASLAHSLYLQGTFEDTAYFEPYYLKDFIAGKPKVKGLK